MQPDMEKRERERERERERRIRPRLQVDVESVPRKQNSDQAILPLLE